MIYVQIACLGIAGVLVAYGLHDLWVRRRKQKAQKQLDAIYIAGLNRKKIAWERVDGVVHIIGAPEDQ